MILVQRLSEDNEFAVGTSETRRPMRSQTDDHSEIADIGGPTATRTRRGSVSSLPGATQSSTR